MIEVDITPDMMAKAQQMSIEMGTLRNSISKGAGNVIGFLGEIIYNSVVEGQHANTYDYDLILDTGETVDVKSKKTSVKPLPHYDCTVAGLNTRQNCDHYGFTRIRNDMGVGWVLGYISKKSFYEKAREWKAGEADPSNGFVVKTDCYSLPISELNQLD